ncbi:MAG: RluA family pseudouridine synthase [Alphaproteobacteria bacterium]|nr:RluA family pseudouridine synthase [Alphaproteobacteria bacterium]
MSGVQIRVVGRKDAELRLDRWFKEHFPDLGFGRLQKLLRTGQVRVDGKRAKAGQKVLAGQEIRVPPLAPKPESGDAPVRRLGPKSAVVSPEDTSLLKSMVIYRSDDVFVVNKPAGLAVQGGAKTERHLDGMLPALAGPDGEVPRLVHRLDRDTSGVMMLARTRKAATALSNALKGKDTRKLYWAITAGVPNPREGEISMALSKSGGPGRERVVADAEDGKSAITWYKVIDAAGARAALVALWPRTGRTHQLRAHMAELGAPILGDGKYGGKSAFLSGDAFPKQVHLHAREIDIPAASDKPTVKGAGARVTAPLPDHMRQSLALLGLNAEDLAEDPFEGWSAPKPRKNKKTGEGRASRGRPAKTARAKRGKRWSTRPRA